MDITERIDKSTMLTASDIMHTDFEPVTPETTIETLGRLFIEHNLTGAPVIDAQGKLIGMVTEYDLISRNKRLHIPTVIRIFDAFITLEGTKTLDDEIRRMAASTVADICTKQVVVIREDTPLDEIATIMAERNIHLLPVVRDGKVVGLIGRHDIVKGLAGEGAGA